MVTVQSELLMLWLGSDLLLEKLFLRKVKAEDVLDVYNLSNEDAVRKFSINPEKIIWEEHLVWFDNILHSNEVIFYVITDCSDQFLGQIRYKIEEKSAIVSLSLCETIRGKGYSNKLLNESLTLISEERNKLETIIAFVSEDNVASKKLFEKANFLFCENKSGMLQYMYSINRGAK
ncbi:N-acetyltransferase [Anaerobacillus alkaliphilus]|uniref:N-acetyltransferase n=1 Tax=Anaerobacillus alkaliphilus TaxID=1548597 RepID=A0A4Q0VUX0_9BACI|nr:GNAT family N-acetyltransferase [Anaerobacillus alkaliphilus]RXJ02233.1 N-acetyltransferase [Anaerobacillus alkaliphilus]